VACVTHSDARAGNRWSLPARGKSCSIGGLWRRAARSFSEVTTGLRQFSEDSARYHRSRAPSSYATLKDDDENPADRYPCVARCLFTEAAIAHPIEGFRSRLGPLPGCHNFVVGTLDTGEEPPLEGRLALPLPGAHVPRLRPIQVALDRHWGKGRWGAAGCATGSTQQTEAAHGGVARCVCHGATLGFYALC